MTASRSRPSVLVIGGGFAGCASAHLLSSNGCEVTLVERAPFLGGGCKTFHYGGHPFTFGPRHFLTKKEWIFSFLNQYVPMRRLLEHEFLTYVERDQAFYHYPIHEAEVSKMPDAVRVKEELLRRANPGDAKNLEDFWIRSVGPTLYSKFVDAYSKKMWRIPDNRELDDFAWSPKGVTLKSVASEKAAWTEAISAFPIANDGYDQYFALATRDSKVLLSTTIDKVDIEGLRVSIRGEWLKYDFIVNTLTPEFLFDGAFGPLRWVGRDFQQIVLPVEAVFPKDVYFLYYANEEPFTRIVEYKKFYNGYHSDTTLLGVEIPSSNGKLYPMPTKADQAKAKVYFDHLPGQVASIGRAGSYRYDVDIDDIIEQAHELVPRVLG